MQAGKRISHAVGTEPLELMDRGRGTSKTAEAGRLHLVTEETAWAEPHIVTNGFWRIMHLVGGGAINIIDKDGFKTATLEVGQLVDSSKAKRAAPLMLAAASSVAA